jgi:hypothetical protein
VAAAVAAVGSDPGWLGSNIPLLDGGMDIEVVAPRVMNGLKGRPCASFLYSPPAALEAKKLSGGIEKKSEGLEGSKFLGPIGKSRLRGSGMVGGTPNA